MTIVGDINIRLDRPEDGNTATRLDLLWTYDLTQFVTQPTHKLGGLLDVVITSNSNSPQSLSDADVGLSDHLIASLHRNGRCKSVF